MAQSGETVFYEHMSPSLLAEQPPEIDDTGPSPGKNWPAIREHLETRRAALRNWRWSWWTHWAELAEFILPRRYHWLVTANQMNKGHPINRSIIDGTATLAMRICASGLWTGLTSPSRPWFKLDIGLPWMELDADGKAWIEDTQERIYTVLAQSNFYTVMAQLFEDVTTFGTAPLIVYEDAEDVIRCYLPCAGEYYLASGSRFSVDTLYREFTMTTAQIVEMFGLDACPESVRELWAEGGGGLEREMVVCHAIEPNFALANRGKTGGAITVVPGGYTFREVYWLAGEATECELSRRGFNERPFMAARWSTVSNDPYGRSPAMDALGDTKQIQLETVRKAEYVDKGVRPPMGADPSMKNEPSSIIPGNVTYTNTDGSKKGFWPLFEVDARWVPAITADIEKVAARVERFFYVDIFMAISRMEGVQPRNELELTKRDLERLQVLGPMITLFEQETSGPAIVRVMATMKRRNMLKPMPQSLRGVPLKLNFVSILRLAQMSAESVAMKDTLATAGALSAAAKAAGVPDPIRIIDLDKALRRYGDTNNFPIDCVFTEDEVSAHDAARQKNQAQAQGLQATMAGVQAAKTLGDTQIGGGTALGAILGHGGGAPINTSGGGQ